MKSLSILDVVFVILALGQALALIILAIRI